MAVFVELCAGSAILSSEASKRGFQTFAIDHEMNRFTPKSKIFVLDLSKDSSQHLLSDMYRQMRPQWTHMGLPCGTASRAREKPVSVHGAPRPRPLRDQNNLLGLGNLTASEQSRVDGANRVYRTAEHVLFQIFLFGLWVSLENPERSWLWAILAMLVKQRGNSEYTAWYFHWADTTFDACQHGSSFAKTTRLKGTPGIFDHLAGRCSGDHEHAQWRVQKLNSSWVFNTAAEAEYPKLLAQRMVDAVATHLQPGLLKFTRQQFRLDLLQQAGKQHRLAQQLIPEYREIILTDSPPTAGAFKILVEPSNAGDNYKGLADGTKYKIGFYFSPAEHFDRAVQLKHPALEFNVVPAVLRVNFFRLCTLGPHAMAQMRIAALKDVIKKKLEMAEQEKLMREGMEDHVRVVTEGKSLLLWKMLLEETTFPDMNVCRYMEEGVRLTGPEEPSPLYMTKYAPATMTVEQLDHQAVWKRRALMGKVMTEEEVEQSADLMRESMEEVAAGFLEGPFTEAQLTQRLGSDEWSLTKRFCLYQGEEKKIRVIDNYRDSGVNSAYASSSYLSLQDTDFIVGMLRFILVVCARRDRVVVPLCSGETLEGDWNSAMLLQPNWLGRCVDLSKAYKQVPIHRDSLKHGVLGFNMPDEGWKLFTTSSLPFGASSAVFSFNKISRSLWHILVHKFGFIMSVFYDDFPIFEVEPLAELSTKIVDAVLNILGWRHAIQGKKAVGFSAEPIALGVQYHLQGLWSGTLTVSNKPGRLERILDLIKQLKAEGSRSSKTAATLAGLMNFAGGFVLGHQFKLGTNALNDWVYHRGVSELEARQVCDYLEVVTKSVEPRVIGLQDCDTPIVIYSDGAFESGKGTWGAFVYDPLDDKRWVFSGTVPEPLLQFWSATVGEQLICEIELFAYICIRWHLRHLLHKRYGLIFIDNESSRMTMIKRSSASNAMFLLVSLISLLDAVLPFSAWCERVPSASNPADLPSRDDAETLCQIFGAKNLGDISLPPYILNFLMRKQFDVDLAELVRFEAVK